ncbi:hypothetical protein pdam_00024918 [Pocillopora damicornis]|uniref:G-protein coupled receptors family 1 profile domain-containing protein n=1 Tax=Pocillopora damicornis TaxID=46731 RepID=A0A3M6TUW1_POCDA|nr:hypothetical protein pdam_00024918 [Pocillopora damicornis]
MERFLAVHLHLRYQELVTHKRVVYMFPLFIRVVTSSNLLPTMIADSIFISFLTYSAIILNAVTIYIVHKASTTAKAVEPFLF